MKDPLVMAHVNMWAVLRTLEPLCELNPYGVHPLYRKRFREYRENLGRESIPE